MFPNHTAPLRTHDEFVNQMDSSHHNRKTILEELPNFNLVDDVALDYLHVVCLGCMRKLLRFWLKRDTRSSLISKEALNKISKKLVDLREHVPSEFARLPRSLKELPRWKATELHQYLLYTEPIVLKDDFPIDLYNHFLALHHAIKLLCSRPKQSEREKVYGHCEKLIKYFIEQAPKMYGWHFLTTKQLRYFTCWFCYSRCQFHSFARNFNCRKKNLRN